VDDADLELRNGELPLRRVYPILATHDRPLGPAVVECNLGIDLDCLELAAADAGRERASGREAAPAKVRALGCAARARGWNQRREMQDQALRALRC
jgi:hypothetical protein